MCLLVEKRWSIFGTQCFGRHPARIPPATLISLPGTEPSSEPAKAHRCLCEKVSCDFDIKEFQPTPILTFTY